MIRTTKPLDELLKDYKFVCLAEDFAFYYDAEVDLHNDIIERYNSPVLTTALHRLEECGEKKTRAGDSIISMGYSWDDAFAVAQHTMKEGDV